MEDDQTGSQPKWKLTKMEADKIGRRPKLKMTKTKTEDDQIVRLEKARVTDKNEPQIWTRAKILKKKEISG